jgi:formylglycine-generating enzyme required for sulfatase activity
LFKVKFLNLRKKMKREMFKKSYLSIRKVGQVLLLSILIAFQITLNAQAEQHVNFELPEMIDIPGGEFEMGCVSGIDCKAREEPVHKVVVPTFQMAKTEVTAELWAACVEAKGCNELESNGMVEPNLPVRYVSWDDVQLFITWLNAETKSHYRLPSEAEWEYAARAGTVTPFNTGFCITDQQANFEGNTFRPAKCSKEGENRKTVLPVASFPANAFGLYDMHGNVWEWVEDCWHENYDNAPIDGSAWHGAISECERHVMRGGTWHGPASYMRSAYRFRYPKEIRTGGLGLRLARSIP